MNDKMTVPLTTTYLRHRISIEPFEWGYLAKIVEPDSDHQLVTVGSSAMSALENAFEFIDDRVKPAAGDSPKLISSAECKKTENSRDKR